MNRWRKICRALAPFEAAEPGLEGLRWPLYLMDPDGNDRAPGLVWRLLSQMRRWFYALGAGSAHPSENAPIWYVLQGATPSHRLPFEAVMQELSKRGLGGRVVVPYRNRHLSMAEGWSQDSIGLGPPEAGPTGVWRMRSRAVDLAREIRAALWREEFWGREGVPSQSLLEYWIYHVLRLDRKAARRLQSDLPRVVVLGQDVGPLRNPLTRHARHQGVHTLVLQHGLQGAWAGSVSSDEVSLWGDYHRRKTIALGAPPERLVVDGSPRMDKILRLVKDPETRLVARDALGISAKEPVVLHILDNLRTMRKLYPDTLEAFLRDSPAALGQISQEATVLVRPHPAAIEQEWSHLQQPGVRIIPPDQMELHEALAAADVASTVVSAAGLEALWCGLPVIYYQPADIAPLVEFPRLGGGIAVRDAAEWSQAAIQMATDSAARHRAVEGSAEFCADTLAYPGEAASRVADRIEGHL